MIEQLKLMHPLFVLLQYIDMKKQCKIGHRPVLAVNEHLLKGLELNWNFLGVQVPKFQYFHLFIFIGHDADQANNFFQAYHNYIDFGQIYGIFCNQFQQSYKKSKIIWNQKSGQFYSLPIIKSIYLVEKISSQLLQSISQNILKRKGLLAINIFFNTKLTQTKKYIQALTTVEGYVKSLRQRTRKSDKIMFNLISNKFSQLSLDNINGLNFFNFDPKNSDTTCKQILKYVKTVVIKSLTLTIEIKQNFNILICSGNKWFISDSTQIQKKYYSVPKIHFSEYLTFLNPTATNIQNFQLKITLTYAFFDDSQRIDKKCLSIKTVSNNETDFKNLNLCQDFSLRKSCEIQKGFFIQTNLLKQESYVVMNNIEPVKSHTNKIKI